MKGTYWDQWSRGEILSLHGIEEKEKEKEKDREDQDRDSSEYDLYENKKERHSCSSCMSCLGLSWRDFL